MQEAVSDYEAKIQQLQDQVELLKQQVGDGSEDLAEQVVELKAQLAKAKDEIEQLVSSAATCAADQLPLYWCSMAVTCSRNMQLQHSVVLSLHGSFDERCPTQHALPHLA
jgi:hypothetical protein